MEFNSGFKGLERAHQVRAVIAKLRHSPGMPAAERQACLWHRDRKRGSMWRTGERRREYGRRRTPATQKETYEESLLKILEQKKT